MLNKEIVQQRIEQRIKKMLSQGFIDEVRKIGETYGWDNAAFDVIGYRAFKDVILGTKTVEQGTADFVRGDMALYKKQVTWFKRNRDVHWLGEAVEAEADALVQSFLGVTNFAL